jgi:NitT/TauT family transport system substrate-binding protein
MRTRLFLTFLVLIPTFVFAGATSAKQTVDDVVYSTGFGFLGRDGFIYVCIEKGFCAEQGINVTVVAGRGASDIMNNIAAGKVDFGDVDFTSGVLNRATNGVQQKMIYVVAQNALTSIVVLKRSNITQPKQLEGRTIGAPAGSAAQTLFPAYAKRAGIDASKVKFVPSAPQALTSLLGAGQVDGIDQFVVGLPLVQAATGQPAVALKYNKYLPGLIGTGIFASDATLATRGDMVRRFLKALDKSIRWSVDNPNGMGAILQKHQPISDGGIAASEMRIMRQVIRTPETQTLGYGYINRQHVNATISLVTNFFHPPNRVTYSDVTDSRFLPGPLKKK